MRSSYQSPEVAGEERSAPDNVRATRHLMEAAETLPDGMATEVVVALSVVEIDAEYSESTTRRAAHRPEVFAGAFRKRPCLPALHASGGYRRPVDAAAVDADVSANVLVAAAPEDLTGARHVLDVGE